ncbi:MAG: DUF3791 domain-containing protein [Coriobacteriales bacterium]|nr:DUF3791 domain-containing protein [Coriobacteriales bacterium]
MSPKARQEIDFSVFLFHHLAKSWHKSVPETYQILADTDILDSYIIGCYESLHTLGTEYLIDDITGFVRDKGVVV